MDLNTSFMGNNISKPLISFHAIVDEDIGVVSNVIKNYRNADVFDLVINRNYHELIGDLYRRKYDNPLYYIMKNEKDKDFLDECYKEFIDNKEEEVLNNSVTTEIYRLVQTFNGSTDISPTILYYTEAQKDILINDSKLCRVDKVSINELMTNIIKKNSFTQYYFKLVDEAIKYDFIKLEEKTFYFSTTARNLNDENDDILEADFYETVFENNSKINLFDMYRTDIIGRYRNV